MRLKIVKSDNPIAVEYELENQEMTLLKALTLIKSTIDSSLTFSAGCRASVCGSCAVRVNGREELSCAYKVKDGDRVEPLNYHPVLRDLKVDKSLIKKHLSQSQAWLHTTQETIVTPKEEKQTQIQTDCILCDICYSACPVYAVNPDFMGPFALTRLYRYSIDPREAETSTLLQTIQTNGVWDCTLCGACTEVCPKGIDSKMDIMMLRGLSVQEGYDDPSFAMMSFGTPDFGGGF